MWKLETVEREKGGAKDRQAGKVYQEGWERDKFRLPDGWERGVRRPQGEWVFWRTVIQRGRNGVGFTGIGERDKAS